MCAEGNPVTIDSVGGMVEPAQAGSRELEQLGHRSSLPERTLRD